ncbi:MAG: hypothetical protein ACOYXB_00565 [Bacteroidota bacterium]
MEDLKRGSINYYRLGRKLEQTYPAIAKELLVKLQPAFKNLDLIPHLYRIYQEIAEAPRSTKEKTEFRTVFIMAITGLYDPESLLGNKARTTDGLRRKLSEVLDCLPTQVSYLYRNGRFFISHYPKFARKVEDLRTRLSEYATNVNKN